MAPSGLTSEASPPLVTERIAVLETLLEAGIPARRPIPGNGCCAALLQHWDGGYAIVRPPFTRIGPEHTRSIAEAVRIAGLQC